MDTTDVPDWVLERQGPEYPHAVAGWGASVFSGYPGALRQEWRNIYFGPTRWGTCEKCGDSFYFYGETIESMCGPCRHGIIQSLDF